MNQMKILYAIVLVALIALPMGGCAKKLAPQSATMEETPGMTDGMTRQGEAGGMQDGAVGESRITEEPVIGENSLTPAAQAAKSTPELQRIFFDYDQYTLTPEARQILADNADFMKQRPQAAVVIEGHSDERGSDEYNLALGERRAQAARDYLLSLGVPSDRLSVVSYGEERPLVQGSGEGTWKQNRRVEFLLR